MSRAWPYLAAGVAAYALVLFATFPAQKFIHLVEARAVGLDVRSVSGTIFSGRARQLVYQGLDLGPVNWRLRPLALLLGRLEYRLQLEHEANAGEADVGLTLAGVVRISDLALVLQQDRIINHYSPIVIGTRGVIRLDIDALEFEEHRPALIAGRAEWADATVVEPVELALGQLTLQLENDAGDLLGTLVNAVASGVSGELRLGESGRYLIDLVLRPDSNTSAETLEILRNVGQSQQDGSFLLRTDGQL